MQHEPLTITEVARELRVTRPTVYSQINAGRLRSYKIGRRRFVTRQALDEYVQHAEREAVRAQA